MKYFTSLVLLLSASASLVAAVPKKENNANANANNIVNDAANNGAGGIAAADKVAEAAALVAAGDSMFLFLPPLRFSCFAFSAVHATNIHSRRHHHRCHLLVHRRHLQGIRSGCDSNGKRQACQEGQPGLIARCAGVMTALDALGNQ